MSYLEAVRPAPIIKRTPPATEVMIKEAIGKHRDGIDPVVIVGLLGCTLTVNELHQMRRVGKSPLERYAVAKVRATTSGLGS